mmetsp:Transcript_22752/g.31717  ORF Transcript_22752/g.31717 Transcript_22752/m.31717 type:complete len:262 (-) Transcript_22752:382-1167(-)
MDCWTSSISPELGAVMASSSAFTFSLASRRLPINLKLEVVVTESVEIMSEIEFLFLRLPPLRLPPFLLRLSCHCRRRTSSSSNPSFSSLSLSAVISSRMRFSSKRTLRLNHPFSSAMTATICTTGMGSSEVSTWLGRPKRMMFLGSNPCLLRCICRFCCRDGVALRNSIFFLSTFSPDLRLSLLNWSRFCRSVNSRSIDLRASNVIGATSLCDSSDEAPCDITQASSSAKLSAYTSSSFISFMKICSTMAFMALRSTPAGI